MTQDEIRKLLGGYATDTLTADERRVLFQAALEDQDLFNALQNEDALRELLADPVSREQVRKALSTPDSELANRDARRGRFLWSRWMYGVAIPAVAAVSLIAVMNRGNAPRQVQTQTAREIPPSASRSSPSYQSPSFQTSPRKSAPKVEAVAPRAKKQANRPSSLASDALSPVIPAPVQLEASKPAAPSVVKSFQVAPGPTVPEAVRQQFAVDLAVVSPLYQGPLVRYSLHRTGPAGDALRIAVTTGITGYLALYQVDSGGKLTRIYPGNDVATPVLPGVTIEIPSNPIKIANAGAKLRLVVVPTSPSTAIGQLGGAVNGAVRVAAPDTAQQAPLVVDIPLASY